VSQQQHRVLTDWLRQPTAHLPILRPRHPPFASQPPQVWRRFHGAHSDSLPPPAEVETDLDDDADYDPRAAQLSRANVPIAHPLIPWLGLLLVTYAVNRSYCVGLAIP